MAAVDDGQRFIYEAKCGYSRIILLHFSRTQVSIQNACCGLLFVFSFLFYGSAPSPHNRKQCDQPRLSERIIFLGNLFSQTHLLCVLGHRVSASPASSSIALEVGKEVNRQFLGFKTLGIGTAPKLSSKTSQGALSGHYGCSRSRGILNWEGTNNGNGSLKIGEQ